jgi:hypothetical protein
MKVFVEARKIWWWLNQSLGYFEKRWKPDVWSKKARFLFIRTEVTVQQKGPIQLDMFEPQEHGYEFKVIVTNKKISARKVVKYHEGRGYQENIFAELKSQGAMDYVPVKTWIGNKIYLLCNLLAHNLVRELQMQAKEVARSTSEKRPPLWIFEGLEVVRRTFIQRAGRVAMPGGVRTLTMSANTAVQKTLLHYLAAA